MCDRSGLTEGLQILYYLFTKWLAHVLCDPAVTLITTVTEFYIFFYPISVVPVTLFQLCLVFTKKRLSTLAIK